MKLRNLVAAIVALVLSATSVHAQDSLRQNVLYVQRFNAPVEYRQWYAQVEKCVGLAGAFDSISWLATPKPWNMHVASDSKPLSATYGMWSAQPDSVTQPDGSIAVRVVGRANIVLTQVDWENPFYVKHEMLHDILGRHGFNAPPGLTNVPDSVNVRRAHPAPPYEKCAPTYIGQMRAMWQVQQRGPWVQVYTP